MEFFQILLKKTSSYINKITKKNLKFKLILKLLFFSSFNDKLDHTNFKRSLINHFKRLDVLSTKYLLTSAEMGFINSRAYINTLTLVSLYSLYKIKYDLILHVKDE